MIWSLILDHSLKNDLWSRSLIFDPTDLDLWSRSFYKWSCPSLIRSAGYSPVKLTWNDLTSGKFRQYVVFLKNYLLCIMYCKCQVSTFNCRPGCSTTSPTCTTTSSLTRPWPPSTRSRTSRTTATAPPKSKRTARRRTRPDWSWPRWPWSTPSSLSQFIIRIYRVSQKACHRLRELFPQPEGARMLGVNSLRLSKCHNGFWKCF